MKRELRHKGVREVGAGRFMAPLLVLVLALSGWGYRSSPASALAGTPKGDGTGQARAAMRTFAGPCASAHVDSFQASDAAKINIPLLVVLEWDTHGIDAFKTWHVALQRAAQFLRQATGDQATIRDVRIVDNACEWANANLRVYANNDGVPDATVGGLGPSTVAAIGGNPAGPSLAITPSLSAGGLFPQGAIHLGRSWGEFGPARGRWTDPDGFRTIVHELGHYAFYLYDEYYGYTSTSSGDTRMTAFCTAPRRYSPSGTPAPLPDDPKASSVMYWEYSTHRFWSGPATAGNPCLQTRQWQVYHKADWQVISAHYPSMIVKSGSTLPVPGCAGSLCTTLPVDRWLLKVRPATGITADGYLIAQDPIRQGGDRVLHEGVLYPKVPPGIDVLPQSDSMPAGLYPPYELEVDGANMGNLVRVTGTYPKSDDTWQAIQQLNGPRGIAILTPHDPGWYGNIRSIPVLDATPTLSGPITDRHVSGLLVNAYDPPAASRLTNESGISATLYEAGLGPANVPRQTQGTLSGTGATHSGFLPLTPIANTAPILDGALYLSSGEKALITNPNEKGTAWELASVSVSCNVPTGYLPAVNAPGDEGGLDSADGVVNVHLSSPGPANFCVGFTRQTGLRMPGTVSPLGAAYAVRGSIALPTGVGATVTLHFDRDLLTSSSRPEIVRASLPALARGKGQGGPGEPLPARVQCVDMGHGTITASVSGPELTGLYQVVMTTAGAPICK